MSWVAKMAKMQHSNQAASRRERMICMEMPCLRRGSEAGLLECF